MPIPEFSRFRRKSECLAFSVSGIYRSGQRRRRKGLEWWLGPTAPDRSSLLSPWPLARLQYTFALQHEHYRVPKQSPQLVRAKVANMRAHGLPSALRSTYLSRYLRRRRPLGWRRGGGAPSACLPPAAGPMTAGLVGSERVRRHPHRRARSAPQCGVSRGPRACRVRVPVPADPSFRPAVADRPAVRRRAPNPCYSAASAAGAAALGHTNLRRIPEGRRMVHHTNPTFSPRCWIRVGFSELTQSFQSLG